MPETANPQGDKIRVSFDLEGDMARAFTAERRKTLMSKAELARAALVYYLNAMGYEVEDTTPPHGGYRERKDDEEKQAVAA